MLARLLIVMMVLTASAVSAQQPLAAPSLPETGTGWLDFMAKILPMIWGVFSPIATQKMVESFPKIFKKVPKQVLLVLSAMLGAAAGAMTGAADSLVLDAGGIKPEVGALEGFTAGLAAHQVASTVTPGAPPSQQPKES